MVVATSAQRYGLPSVRCSVTAKSTGEPCQLYAIPGSTVCHMHGAGAPQVKVAARARALLADVASRDPRPIGDAILDAINTADVVHRYLKERLIGGEDMSAGDLDMLMSTAERVVSMGKAAAITKLVELKVGQIHEDAKRISLALGAVMHILTDHIDGLEPRGDLGLYSSPRNAFLRWAAQSFIDALLAVADNPSTTVARNAVLPFPDAVRLSAEPGVPSYPRSVWPTARALPPGFSSPPGGSRTDPEARRGAPCGCPTCLNNYGPLPPARSEPLTDSAPRPSATSSGVAGARTDDGTEDHAAAAFQSPSSSSAGPRFLTYADLPNVGRVDLSSRNETDAPPTTPPEETHDD
ncbi:hypothetical protein [Jiangella alba]|uniref:Uncharacterized protein n=1 Tax=Jiangella alba TaxID=561176 RepID=A0A1H5MPB9_9ACTN|nr:hypothetical protein [Jiangella alba]SEE91146.1 hypothetical protein SAMN04488561_3315 [Jiangella alba]